MKSVIAGAKRISSSVIGNPFGFDHENEFFAEADEEPVNMVSKVMAAMPAVEPAAAEIAADYDSIASMEEKHTGFKI